MNGHRYRNSTAFVEAARKNDPLLARIRELEAENERLRASAVGANVGAEIAAERTRQVGHGYDAEHDDEHTDGSIARAAAAYAYAGSYPEPLREYHGGTAFVWYGKTTLLGQIWPWDRESFRPRSRRRDLVKAAALIIAEIERLDRAGERE